MKDKKFVPIAVFLTMSYLVTMGMGFVIGTDLKEDIKARLNKAKIQFVLNSKKTIDEVVKIGIEKTKKALQEKNYTIADYSLDSLESYLKDHAQDIPNEITLLRNQVYDLGIQTHLDMAKDLLEEKNYLQAQNCLDIAEIYCHKLKKDIPSKINDLRKLGYKIGTDENFRKSKEFLKQGNFFQAHRHLDTVEFYYKKLNSEIPEKVKKLRDDIYKSEELRRMLMELFNGLHNYNKI